MTEETNVSPVEETQNQSTEPTQTPEVVAPENVESEQRQAEPEKVEDDREKALKRMQRRIDRRTAELYKERAEREQLAARIAQLEQRPQQGEQQQEEPKADPYKLAEEIAAVKSFNEKCNAVAAEGTKKFKDFDEALQNLAGEVGPLFDQRGKPTDLMKVVMEADSPAALLHHLGTNPEIAAELTDLSPTQLARRLDRIERDMSQAAKPKVSQAPRPLTPVKPTAAANRMPDPSDTKAYIKWANEQERAERR